MTNDIRLTNSVGDTTPGFTIRIGDNNYNSQCSYKLTGPV